LGGEASMSAIAAATLEASERKLKEASNDLALRYSYWLLTQLPRAARAVDFIEALRGIGLRISDQPSLMDLLGSFTQAIDSEVYESSARSDVGEMAQLAATECLTEWCSRQIGNLFGTTEDDLRNALRKLDNPRNFGAFSRDFFSRFASRYLKYFLSMELSNHVGEGKTLASVEDHIGFNREFDYHIRQTSDIVQRFSADWYFKHAIEGEATLQDVSGFLFVALKKIRRDLTRAGR
jgi:hypothetical protein